MEGKPLIIAHSNLDLFEFTQAVKEWYIDFIQLGGGEFRITMNQIIFPEFQLAHVHFNSKVKQEGRSPKGYWTFAFVRDFHLYWRNFEVSPRSIVIYAPNSEINSVSNPLFEPLLFSIEEGILLELARQDNSKQLLAKIQSGVLQAKGDLFDTLSIQIMDGINNYKNDPNYDGKHIFTNTFVIQLLQLIKKSEPSTKKVSSKKRLQLLVDAERFIQNNIDENVTVSEIATQCGVSKRTLLYAFKRRFNTGPKAFMKILKLNHVHHLLHGSKDIGSISSIARASGFWHMGQFFKDFKDFFGELPSETIKKGWID
jgi:AraC family transcriptional regulator, ethanolamine operon transcriptional activator